MSVAGADRLRRRSGPGLAAMATMAVAVALCAGLLWPIFDAGGFFPATVAIAAIVAGALLATFVVVVPRPFAAASRPLLAAVGALAAFGAWSLASRGWSDAPGRALLEADRVLLYALMVALAGLAAGLPAVRRAVAPAVAGALALASAAGVASRLVPAVWPIPADVDFERLSYPLTYWNGQGLLSAMAVVACLHLACAADRPRAVRALAAGAIPIAACALLLTFSRGALYLAPVGVVAYLLLARPRGAPGALLATVPTTAIALLVTWRADDVVSAASAAELPVDAGRAVAATIAVCALTAAVGTVLGAGLDRHAPGWRAPALPRRWRVALGAAAAVVLVGGAAAAGAPARISDEAERLSSSTFQGSGDDPRGRLMSLADNGRVDQWGVALDAFAQRPLTGAGAGTYAVLWTEHRPTRQDVHDGHSLYLEALAETGVVGAALLLAALGALLAGAIARMRRGDRAGGAIGVVLLATWALHAGIDWDWELAGLTLPALVLAGAAASRPGAQAWRAAADGRRTAGAPRAVVAAAALVVLVAPLAIVRSQGPLDAAAQAMAAGDCATATVQARRSIDALSWRAEPYQLLALCQARLGHGDVAVDTMQAALDRDPGNWRMLLGLAVLRAQQGLDPRPTLEEAHARNPRSRLVRGALQRFAGAGDSAAWQRRAVRVAIPL